MPQPEQYLAYVDESGDIGLSTNSKPWFILSACVMKASVAPITSGYIDEAKQDLWIANGQTPPNVLSWKSLKFPFRQALVPRFTSKPYTQIVVGFWKPRLTRTNVSGLQDSNVAYRYACRLLIERLSWFVRDKNGRVRITFDKTDRLDLPQLTSYITYLQSQSGCKIADVIDGIRVSSATRTKLLTLADNAASSFASGFNPDRLGNLCPFFATPSVPHLYRRGRLWGYGLKIMPSDVSQQSYIISYPFTKSWF